MDSTGGDMGFLPALSLVLIALKLTGTISITWFLAFLPLLIPFIFFIVMVIFAMIVGK